MTDAPHAARPPSPLRNGNRQGDWNNAPRCGAKTRKGTPCKRVACHNGGCPSHFGHGRGPQTAAGRAKVSLNLLNTPSWRKHMEKLAAAAQT